MRNLSISFIFQEQTVDVVDPFFVFVFFLLIFELLIILSNFHHVYFAVLFLISWVDAYLVNF